MRAGLHAIPHHRTGPYAETNANAECVAFDCCVVFCVQRLGTKKNIVQLAKQYWHQLNGDYCRACVCVRFLMNALSIVVFVTTHN